MRKSAYAYQDSRYPGDQFQLISQTEEFANARSFLEVGCNAGVLTELVAGTGRFSVGIDVKQHWRNRDHTAALGVFPLDRHSLKALPKFDMVAVLSVHHQWIATQGDELAAELMSSILDKARIATIVEFAAICRKYGAQPDSLFVDNEEESIRKYAEGYIDTLGKSYRYLGRAREKANTEPYRYVYIIK